MVTGFIHPMATSKRLRSNFVATTNTNYIMISIKAFSFNPFMVNTYLLYTSRGDCLIVDAGCQTKEEEKQLLDFIQQNDLHPSALVNTHTHIDHILGNRFVHETFGLLPLMHPDAIILYQSAMEYGSMFGMEVPELPMPSQFLSDDYSIEIGSIQLTILHTPGHADGSVCLVCHDDAFVITGDVLFSGSIGRTDLPGGNFDLLAENIVKKLYSLPGYYVVYPGHGPATNIGREKASNPFVRG